MPWKKEGWKGGRIWIGKDGTETYYIWRMVGGHRYNVSTRCTDLQSAFRHLDRFETDPAAYDAAPPRPEELRLTDELIAEFVEAGRRKGNSEGRIWKRERYMEWWQERLKGDLRTASLRDLSKALDNAPNPGGRINVIKAFWGWLRETGRTESDPTASLHVQPGRPAQWDGSKVVTEADHAAVCARIPERYRDLLEVLWHTGWHVSELERFCREGKIELLDRDPGYRGHWEARTPFILHCPRHKSGDAGRTAVDMDCQAAAKRCLEAGPFSRVMLYKELRRACQDAGVEPYAAGQYRHSLATRFIEGGATPEAVSAFLGHRSASTTKRFYATLAIVPNPDPALKEG